MVATFTVNIILSAIHGHPSDLSNPGLISFGRFSVRLIFIVNFIGLLRQFQHITYEAVEIPIFLAMAVIGT